MKQQKQSAFKSYLKLAFNNVELLKHIHFQKINRKQPSLQFLIDAQYIDQNKKSIASFPQVKLSQVLANEGSMFYPKSNRWDCILLEQKSQEIKESLRLKFTISEREKKSNYRYEVTSMIKEKSKTKIKSQQSQQSSSLSSNTLKQSKSSKISIIQPPFQCQFIIIPLQKFLKQPYKIHEITMNFYIPLENKRKIQVSSNEQQTKPSNNQKRDAQKDGILNFQLVYLPKFKTELKFHGIKLRTNAFSKQFKLCICQVKNQQQKVKRSQNQSFIMGGNYASTLFGQNQAEQILKQYQIQSKLNVPLQCVDWQLYVNQASIVSPLVLPITLNNNLDQVLLLIEFENQNKNKLNQQQKSSKVTLSKFISMDYFYQKKQDRKHDQDKKKAQDLKKAQDKKKGNDKKNDQDKKKGDDRKKDQEKNQVKGVQQKITFHTKNKTFEVQLQLEFEFQISIQTGLQKQKQNFNLAEKSFQESENQNTLDLQSKVIVDNFVK